jgi:hypothetical protein
MKGVPKGSIITTEQTAIVQEKCEIIQRDNT